MRKKSKKIKAFTAVGKPGFRYVRDAAEGRRVLGRNLDTVFEAPGARVFPMASKARKKKLKTYRRRRTHDDRVQHRISLALRRYTRTGHSMLLPQFAEAIAHSFFAPEIPLHTSGAWLEPNWTNWIFPRLVSFVASRLGDIREYEEFVADVVRRELARR